MARSTPSRQSLAVDSAALLPASVATNIKVIARFRPHNADELAADAQGTSIAEFLSEDSVHLETKDFSGAFTFDRVFDMYSSQLDVFNYSLKQTVDDLLNGYNGTVFAYGQTGSGKSYTMMGPNNAIDDREYRGAIPRIVDRIFDLILQSSEDIEYTVKVSYMEIYMERIRDLLNPASDNLPIHEDKTRGIYVKGLTEEYVSSADEVYEVMRQGAAVRAVASTNMNQESSRSHSIFVTTVSQKNTLTGAQKTGQLSLVDLAGSEKVGKTGASGQTLEEAKKINKSLSALGMVINSLTDGKSTHIPYRDSKLTRILQESLGGNSRTSLIVNCSPSTFNDSETLSTLRFGVRAKSIKNTAKINTELSPLELRQLLRKCQSQLETHISYTAKLEAELTSWRSGETPPKDSWISLGGGASGTLHSAPGSARSSLTNTKSGASSVSRPSTPSTLRRPNIGATSKRLSVSDSPFGKPKQSKLGSSAAADSTSPSTPVVDGDQEFVHRESDLHDQIAEKDSIINEQEQLLHSLQERLDNLSLTEEDGDDNDDAKSTGSGSKQSLKTAAGELTKNNTELKLQIDNLNYEKKELSITTESLTDENTRLTAELQQVKQQLIEFELERKNNAPAAGSLRTFDDAENKTNITESSNANKSSDEGTVDKENQVPAIPTTDAEKLSPAELHEKKKQKKMSEILGQFYQVPGSSTTSLNIDSGGSLSATPSVIDVSLLRPESKELSKYLDSLLETQHTKFEEYIASAAGSDEEKKELSKVYEAKIKAGEETTRELLAEISKLKYDQKQSTEKPADKDADGHITVPVSTIKEKEAQVAQAQDQIETMQSHIAQYESLKSSLMRDLQERCERVVELEISLDAAREQYNLAIRNSNTKQQQKKMGLLQRNLEQLTSVQRQLVEQNVALKRDVAMAHRILESRNDRIQDLENALRESQTQLGQESELFETQLTYLRDRLVEVKRTGSSAGLASSPSPLLPSPTFGIPSTVSHGADNRVIHYPDLSPTKPRADASSSLFGQQANRVVSGGAHTKIVKPLRGGGGGGTNTSLTGGAPSTPQTPIKQRADAVAKSVSGLWTKIANSTAASSSTLVAAAKTQLGSPKKNNSSAVQPREFSDTDEDELDAKTAAERQREGALLSGSTAYSPSMSP